MIRVLGMLPAAALPLACLALSAQAQVIEYGSPNMAVADVKPNFGPVLSNVYGQGVHAFFAGRYDDASRLLNDAISNGYVDPRAYYFRGLVAEMQGNQYEAEADWQVGAELEAAGKVNGNINRSLARIQGYCRARLEKARREARVRALTLQKARSDARVREIQSAAPAAVSPAPAPASDTNDPFIDDADLGQPKTQAEDVLGDAMDAAADPLASDGSADDTGDAMPAGDAVETGNPFGGDTPDPFGDPGDANPFGGSGTDNPFGDSPF